VTVKFTVGYVIVDKMTVVKMTVRKMTVIKIMVHIKAVDKKL
jgi:hypothetical protein